MDYPLSDLSQTTDPLKRVTEDGPGPSRSAARASQAGEGAPKLNRDKPQALTHISRTILLSQLANCALTSHGIVKKLLC